MPGTVWSVGELQLHKRQSSKTLNLMLTSGFHMCTQEHIYHTQKERERKKKEIQVVKLANVYKKYCFLSGSCINNWFQGDEQGSLELQ